VAAQSDHVHKQMKIRRGHDAGSTGSGGDRSNERASLAARLGSLAWAGASTGAAALGSPVALALLTTWMLASSVAAQPMAAACASSQVQISQPLDPVWAERVRLLCLGLAHRGDLDPAATLAIGPAPSGGLELRASLRDGRSALRRVDTAEALTFTAEALLVLPVGPPPSAAAARPIASDAATPPPTAADAISGRRATAATALPDEPDSVAPPLEKTPVHLMLQASALGHLSATPAVVGGGFALHAAVRFQRVFLEVAPRWEAQTASLRTRLSDFEMHTIAVALQAGLRFWASAAGAGEVGAGVLIASETQTYRPVSKEVGGDLIGCEFTTFARLLWGDGPVRWAVSSDLTLAPGRLSHATHIRDIFPALPVFAFGFAFGVHWESS
jgi:hypothetical protein